MMQQYALVQNGQIEATEFFKRPNLAPDGWQVIEEIVPEFDAETHQLGEKALQVLPDGSVAYVWSVVEIPPPTVPAEIQMWQARAILSRVGLLDNVNQAIAASNNPEIQIAWEYAPNVVRRSVFVTSMATALNIDDATIDNLFVEASKIK
jgi:hypothetical protein